MSEVYVLDIDPVMIPGCDGSNPISEASNLLVSELHSDERHQGTVLLNHRGGR